MVLVVGLTGGIACGKSTASRVLREEGAHVIDADEVARAVLAPGTPAAKQAAEAFKDAEGVVEHTARGPAINRERLGEVIFADSAKRRRLGEIVNRPIFFAMARALCAAWWALPPGALVVLDVPLLFETVVFAWVCEGVVVVTAPEAVQLKRLVARNGYAPAHAQARIDAQMPQEEKRRRATHVIDNSGTVEEMALQVREAAAALRAARRAFPPLRVLLCALGCLGAAACVLAYRLRKAARA